MIGNNIIPDPDFDGWDGTCIGVEDAPVLKYNLQKLLYYATENNKSVKELSQQEIEMFRIKGR